MKVLLINQYYPPEIEPSANKIHYLACRLAEGGDDVTVITGFPNYPTGIIPTEYRGKLYQTDVQDGVRILRTFVLPSSSRGLIRRVANQLSFLFSATVRSLLAGRPDLVFASSPPLEAGLAGYLVSRIKRVPFIFEVRDAWPKAAVAVGVLRNRTVIAAAEAVERFLYRHADRIIVVAPMLEPHVVENGGTKDNVTLIPHLADTDLFRPDKQNVALRAELGLDGKFIAIYAGTHGLQANLGSVLQAASSLQDRENILFLFVGDGSEKRELQRRATELGLRNVAFVDAQPRDQLAKFLAVADVGILSIRRDPFFEGYRPVKLFDYMAAGCPVILGANGESRTLVENERVGVWVGAEDPVQMAKAIVNLYENPEQCRVLGQNGREYAVKHCSRAVLLGRYQDVFASVMNSKQGAKRD